MGHKAGREFHDAKRPWSRYKDRVLGYYLPPYLEKVKSLGKPILIVDMFAGPGRTAQAPVEDGSPRIICKAAKRLVDRGFPVQVWLFENDKVLYGKLRENVAEFSNFASVERCNCFDHIQEIAKASKDSTTLLYVDPFAVAPLDLRKLASVYSSIHAGASVEVLLVFFADKLARWAGQYVGDKKTLWDDDHFVELIFPDDSDKGLEDVLKAF